jgi:hypothetical protein
LKAAIDRIEGEIAVLVMQEGEPAQVALPASLLPEGSREGDIVTIGIGRDPEATAAARQGTFRTIERLRNRGR